MKLTKRWLRPLTALSALLLAVTMGEGIIQAPANASTSGTESCIQEQYFGGWTNRTVWIGTNEYSQWQGAAGTISMTITGSNTAGHVLSSSVTVGVSTIIAKAEAKFGYDISQSTTLSKSWGYTLVVPAGKQVRARSYKKGLRIGFTKYEDTAKCTTRVLGSGYAIVPYASNNNAYYCITRDAYPGVNYMYDTCVAH